MIVCLSKQPSFAQWGKWLFERCHCWTWAVWLNACWWMYSVNFPHGARQDTLSQHWLHLVIWTSTVQMTGFEHGRPPPDLLGLPYLRSRVKINPTFRLLGSLKCNVFTFYEGAGPEPETVCAHGFNLPFLNGHLILKVMGCGKGRALTTIPALTPEPAIAGSPLHLSLRVALQFFAQSNTLLGRGSWLINVWLTWGYRVLPLSSIWGILIASQPQDSA